MEGNKYRIEQIDRDRFAEIRKKFLHIIYNLSQTFYSQDQYITVSVPKTLLFEINDSDLFFFFLLFKKQCHHIYNVIHSNNKIRQRKMKFIKSTALDI